MGGGTASARGARKGGGSSRGGRRAGGAGAAGAGAAAGSSPVRGGARSLTEELDEDQTLEDAEESPAGTGWSNMGGGGDEHIGHEGRTGSPDWDEDWGGGGDVGEDEEDKTPYEEKSGEE